MEPKTFVERLAAFAPSISELVRLGLTEVEAGNMCNSYICRKRRMERRVADPLLALLNNWDLGHVEIGMVQFLSRPEEMPGKMCIGSVEADPLYVLESTGELISEELHVQGYILWTVARNGSMFLDALIPAAEFLQKCGIGEIEIDDFRAARVVAERCATLAGGERYLQFYSVLLGAD